MFVATERYIRRGIMANWASGASEGLTQGINNAINIMAAKRAQEDQAYQDKVRQQTAAEYEFNHAPVASIGDLVSSMNLYTPEAKAKAEGYIKSVAPGEQMFSRKRILELRNIYNGDPMFKTNIAAEEYNGFNNKLKNAKPDEQVGIKTMMEASPWYQGHAAEVAAKKELEAKRARESAEEAQKVQERPLQIKKIEADIAYTKAKAREAGKPSGVGGGGLTAKQLYDIEDKRRKEATGRVEKRLKWYDDYIQEYEGMNNKPKNYNQVIEYRNKTQKVLDRIHSGELDPTKLIWGGQSSQWQQVAPGSNVPAFDISLGKNPTNKQIQQAAQQAANGMIPGKKVRPLAYYNKRGGATASY
jgi:hypothetical protein